MVTILLLPTRDQCATASTITSRWSYFKHRVINTRPPSTGDDESSFQTHNNVVTISFILYEQSRRERERE